MQLNSPNCLVRLDLDEYTGAICATATLGEPTLLGQAIPATDDGCDRTSQWQVYIGPRKTGPPFKARHDALERLVTAAADTVEQQVISCDDDCC